MKRRLIFMIDRDEFWQQTSAFSAGGSMNWHNLSKGQFNKMYLNVLKMQSS